MNPLTQFKKIPILPLLIALALATPPSGVTSVPIADGTFDDIDVHIKSGAWKALIDTKGASGTKRFAVFYSSACSKGVHK